MQVQSVTPVLGQILEPGLPCFATRSRTPHARQRPGPLWGMQLWLHTGGCTLEWVPRDMVVGSRKSDDNLTHKEATSGNGVTHPSR